MSQVGVHIVSASLDSNRLTLDFSVSRTVPGKGVELYVILAEDKTSSNVPRGEKLGSHAVSRLRRKHHNEGRRYSSSYGTHNPPSSIGIRSTVQRFQPSPYLVRPSTR